MAMNLNLLKDALFTRVQNAAAAGTTTLAGTTLDMQGYDSVMFIYGLGALTATQVTKLKLGEGAASDGSDAADVAGAVTAAMADADSNKLLILEYYHPQARYVTPSLVRGTANAVVDFGIAIRYNQRKGPQTQGTTVSASALKIN